LCRVCYVFVVAQRTNTLRLAIGALTLGLIGFAGCGNHRPPPQGDGTMTGGPAVAGGGANQFNLDGGSLKPPGCGTKADGSQCECLDVPLFVDPPTIYFVLDRSGSMGVNDKWTQIRVVVGQIMRGLGPRANFGATMFPGQANNCAPGDEVMSIRGGDPPSSSVDGPTTTMLLAVTRVTPNGGTPTASTLNAVRSTLRGVSGRVFVILATDGAPNCNATAPCGFDQCQPNIEDLPGCPREGPFNCCEPPNGHPEDCNDGSPTLSAIAALKAAQVPVYVVGLPGAGTYGTLLDDMATAGGTALPSSPKYFAVTTASSDSMLSALKKVTAKITGTCSFDLKAAPVDPSVVNVYLDDVVLPYEPVNGWAISDKTITLLGSACERVKSGDALDVRIITGCPRVEPR
jgi:hypothetical protein